MELQILKEKENQLFGRKEISGIMKSRISPSRAEVVKIISTKFGVPEAQIKIKGIRGKFGSDSFSIEANLYASKEEKDLTELKKKKDQSLEVKSEEVKSQKSKYNGKKIKSSKER